MPTSPLHGSQRLFPVEPQQRAIANDLYAQVATLPILSPHSHVPVEWLSLNTPFTDATDLFVVHDHYVTRLLHALGVDLDDLGQGASSYSPRAVWRLLCEHWHRFAGTASAGWLKEELASLFGITEELSLATADSTFDAISARLSTPEFLPRALFESLGIEVLATTDDPMSGLEHHEKLAFPGALSGRVLPTFRPDAYLDPDAPLYRVNVMRLLASNGGGSTAMSSFLSALQARREFFISRGAVSADHGVIEPLTVDLDDATADRLFQDSLRGRLDEEGKRMLRGHMLFQMARMSVEDGLVMTVHAGVLRNHHTASHDRYGPDTGHDIPLRTEFTRNLRPLLQKFGTERDFHLVLFTVDEATYSRELAPLAGFYPSVFIGAPWWFLDAPDAYQRYRAAVTETAGFYKTSGFIDDTRAYLSIPARHDTARRLDAAFIARLVCEDRISLTTAQKVMTDVVDTIPRTVFKL